MALIATRRDAVRGLQSSSKTVVSQGTVGSNPTPSARGKGWFSGSGHEVPTGDHPSRTPQQASGGHAPKTIDGYGSPGRAPHSPGAMPPRRALRSALVGPRGRQPPRRGPARAQLGVTPPQSWPVGSTRGREEQRILGCEGFRIPRLLVWAWEAER